MEAHSHSRVPGSRLGSAALVLLLCSVAPVAPVAAQGVDMERARRLDNAGKQAYLDGRFDVAAEAFEGAYDANELPKYRFNAAKAWEKMGDLPRAAAAYEDYLDLAPDAEDVEKVRTALTHIDYQLRRVNGLVRISSDPTGASFVLAMDDVRRSGTTPLEVWVPPGRWVLRLEKAGYVASEREVSVLVGVEQEIASHLAPVAVAAGAAGPGGPRPGAPQMERPPRFGAVSWTSFAVAGGALLGGVLLSVLSRSKLREYEDYVAAKDSPGRTRAGADSLGSSAEGLSTTGTVLFGVAGVATATGLLVPVFEGTW